MDTVSALQGEKILELWVLTERLQAKIHREYAQELRRILLLLKINK